MAFILSGLQYCYKAGKFVIDKGPWLGVQISNQSALNLMRVHPDSSLSISMQK